jgi:hypothetical protein
MRVFLRCVKAALGAGASDPAALASCLDDPANPRSIAADRSGALARSQSRLSGVIRSRCASVTTAQPFPGSCAGLAGDDLGRCLSERVRCRSCRTVAGVTHLAVDCDGFDDAQPNASCG